MGEMKSASSTIVIIGLFVCLALFLLIFFYIPAKGPSRLDEAVGEWLIGTETSAWTKVMDVAAYLGETLPIIVITLLLTAVAAWFTGFRKALWVFAGVAIAYFVYSVLKEWIARPRPDAAWGIEVDGFSFPSGSATLAMVMYSLFAIWIGKYSKINIGVKATISSVAVLLIILVGWSRLYFSVHYVTDIVAAYAVGGLIILLMMFVEMKFKKSR